MRGLLGTGDDQPRVLTGVRGGLAATADPSETAPVEEGDAWHPDSEEEEAAEAAARRRELQLTMDLVRRRLGARRVLLWDVDDAEGRARARVAAGGELPGPVRLLGDPLHWAWTEGLPLRLDTAPHWGAGSGLTCIAPVQRLEGRGTLLSVDFEESRRNVRLDALAELAAYLRGFLRMQEREAKAAAARARSVLMVELLRRLPRPSDLGGFAGELVECAQALVPDATGAVFALWERDSGRVLAVAGGDGGVEPGALFGPLESELALAARGGVPITRVERRSRRDTLPIIAPEELWRIPPRAAQVVPLRDPASGVLGLVAVWSSRSPWMDPDGVEMLQTIAPYAALQLEQVLRIHALRDSAERDALTGLCNRRSFEARFASEGARFNRYRRPLSLLLLDLDHFKRINDHFGHEAGDEVLREVGRTIQGTIRETDLAARFGGEEFAVILSETKLEAALEAAERLRARIERAEVSWQGERVPVRASIGVSACPDSVSGPGELMASADAMLYTSKRAGRNRVTAAPPIE